ncbi:hypothetical protein INT48_003405 [Thamnidium elegans]|uniref:Uncharacterized protein n=1 Tax=Thamnidium elegans TaxID=101142 RepID=A0A8H7SUJ6_9FUNG|nr:hypothetical protein INT48_003405 [Thamnidium elegans]
MLSTHANKKLRPRLKVVATTFSQSTPTNIYSPQRTDFMDDTPYSPAASTTSFISSVSWVAEKSASELGSLLKNAYRSLREKEKNLLLAAEIGKSLLEHNQNLKRDYEHLLQNVKSCESVTKPLKQDSYEDDDDDENTTMRILSSKKAHDTIVESLEQKNAEIKSMLEQTQQHSQLTEQQYEKKQRKLESEIEILKDHLDIAANKIHELEESNQQKRQQRKNLDEIREFEQQQKTDDLFLMEELTVKMQELFTENKQLQSSKKSVEEKLITSLHDLEKLRSNFEHFELTHQGYSTLQESFERQTTHIKELNDSLEDHRQILSRLRDKGLLHSNTTSLHDFDDDKPTVSTSSMQSLMGELENAFWSTCHKNNNSSAKLQKSNSDTSLSSFSKIYDLATMTERNLTSFCSDPADYAFEKLLNTMGVPDRSVFDDAEHLLDSSFCGELFEPEGNGSIYAERNLYPSTTTISTQLLRMDDHLTTIPPKGLTNRILFQIRYLFRSIFKWCRFAIILETAVLINLWKGPDLILEK